MMRKFKLRSLLSKHSSYPVDDGPTLESSGNLNDYLVVTVPSYVSPEEMTTLRNYLVRDLQTERIMVLHEGVEFLVFEEEFE